MKTTNTKWWLSLILCLVLMAAMALLTTGCNDTTETPQTSAETTAATEVNVETTADTVAETTAPTSDITVKGEGDTMFYFNVIDKDGNITKFEIHTDKKTVGEALVALELISGEAGAFGLYVKTVNGITADYDTDQTYWEFFVGEQSSPTGVDLTNITPEATYAFKVSK